MAIGVDIEGLEGAATRVDGIAGNFRSDLDSLGKLVQETGSYMQNGPQQAFEAKYGHEMWMQEFGKNYLEMEAEDVDEVC